MGALWFSLLARDLFQVALSGTTLVPDLVVLALVWLAINRCEDTAGLFVPAFLAGLFWDLRWTALPGMTSTSYILVVAVTSWIWVHIPAGKRHNPVLFFIWMVFAHGFSSSLPALFSGQGVRLSAHLLSQQGMAVACALGLTALFIRRARNHHE
jgi:cell shape-determining protein MreD